ncbi:MAG: ABC transporter substrate-binding protein [Pikeienuella sp.]
MTKFRTMADQTATFAPLTRRAFGVGALSAGGVWLAGAQSPALAQEQPKRGGAVRFAYAHGDVTEALDPALFDDTIEYVRGLCMFAYLTSLNTRGEAVAEAAESWEPNADATVWTFRIRSGIVFTDGSPLTAEDVIFSIMRHKDEKVSSTAKALVENLVSAKKISDDQVAFELASADVDFPITVGLYQFGLLKDGTNDFSDPYKIVGAGPFILKEFQPGIRSVYERNPDYWKEGRPYIDQLETFPIPDTAARVNALLAGDVDLISDVRGNAIDEVKNSATASLFVTPAARYTALQSIATMAPSDNVELNFALSYLFDRKRILDTVMRGNGQIGNDHPIAPSSPYYNADLPQRELDHDKAKFHFAKSGFGSTPLEVSASVAAVFSVEMGQILAREASRIGLNVRIRNESSDGYWTVVTGKKPYSFSNFNPRPTYNQLLNLAWRSGAVWNFSHYENPQLDELIDLTRSTLDIGQRTAHYHDLQEIIYNSGAIMLPTFFNYVDGHSKKLKGLEPIPINPLGGSNFAVNVWIDDNA